VTRRNRATAESIVALSIKLEAATRRKGNLWLAWCLPIDVITQAETKQAALRSLKEAVELWFESCIARNVLEEALLEAGFHKTKIGAMIPKNAGPVKAPAPKSLPAHALPAKRDYIEVSIPAYIAAHGNSDILRAPR
jgi:predicted RNase H-like HicB family nuclease